jgi:hypothetical protein
MKYRKTKTPFFMDVSRSVMSILCFSKITKYQGENI